MIQIHTTIKTKERTQKDIWYISDHCINNFKDLDSAKKYIKATYGNHKRSKMYVDNLDGTSKHIGYVYCFRDEEGYKQYWVEFRSVELINPVKGT